MAGSLSILPVAVTQLLFNHILDVLKDVPSFHLEYGALLRHLLASRHYRFHIGRKVYGSKYPMSYELKAYGFYLFSNVII